MKILIDADGCPVVDICIKSAKRHGIECLILCDTSHIFEREGAKTVMRAAPLPNRATRSASDTWT